MREPFNNLKTMKIVYATIILNAILYTHYTIHKTTTNIKTYEVEKHPPLFFLILYYGSYQAMLLF